MMFSFWHRGTVIAPRNNSNDSGPITAAMEPPSVISMPVVADPPVVYIIIIRAVAVPSGIAIVGLIAVIKVEIPSQIAFMIWVRKNATKPSFAPALKRALKVRTPGICGAQLPIFCSKVTGGLYRVCALPILEHSDSFRLCVIPIPSTVNLFIILPTWACIIFTVLGVSGFDREQL
jgi:hypothetical protein